MNGKTRSYDAMNSVVFRKTKEQYGGLSNMASGYPIKLNGICIRSSEALYQALKFPYNPEIQQKILSEKSPMTAKMVSKKNKDNIRTDWLDIRLRVMKWVIRIKLVNNWGRFGNLLISTYPCAIVEDSSKDIYWGAMKISETAYRGENVLGRLLMDLRDEFILVSQKQNYILRPPTIKDLVLLGEPIRTIKISIDEQNESISMAKKLTLEAERASEDDSNEDIDYQLSINDFSD